MYGGETSTRGNNPYESPQSHASPIRYDLNQPEIFYDESVLNYKPKCVVEQKDVDFIVPTELEIMPDDWNEIQKWGKKTKLQCEVFKRPYSKRFKSIKAIFDSCRKHHANVPYNLNDDQRYIFYNDESENEMKPIVEIINLPLFCKGPPEFMQQIAEMSHEQASGISFPVTNHYSDLKKHVLLLGLVPNCYEDATKHFAKFRRESVVTSLIECGISCFDQRPESHKLLKITGHKGDNYFGPFFDGQLEIFVLLYYVLETQDLVNFKLVPDLRKCKQILSFLFDKLDKENDYDLKRIDKYMEFDSREILERKYKRRRLTKEKGISLPLLFWIKKNFVKILDNTDTAYHDHWHNLMQALGLHHYRCPHTYNEVFRMYFEFLQDHFPAYIRNCVNSDSETDVDVRDVFRLYPNFKNNMPPSVNHSINGLLNAFSYDFAEFLFRTNHYNRKLETETVNCYLNELHCPIKNLGLIVESGSEVSQRFKDKLTGNVKFLAFLKRKRCFRFEISSENNLSLAIQRFLEKTLPLDLLRPQGNAHIKWDLIEEKITKLKDQKFSKFEKREFNENVYAFDEIGDEMETGGEANLADHRMIERNDSHTYNDFDDCRFKYHAEEVTPTVCVGCCYGKKKTNRYLILDERYLVAFCTWCTWCLNNKYSEYISELLRIVEEKYEQPIFLDQMNQRISYSAIKNAGKTTHRSYNRSKNLQKRELSRCGGEPRIDIVIRNRRLEMEHLSDSSDDADDSD
uniref:Uncharacterized protein n=1 Tax=Tetranychus urticae TaxID=32264 RepID=T1K3T4_TETUR